ncbi:MAG: hypothetical protein JWO20_164 [Candidatus Angelobacter sp.]|jgi:hypothetical protein|nr:hypothetical protein [Candidatus Angelobacter sp.]
MMSLGEQIIWLLLLAIPVACISWTITHEEVFREPREYCQRRSETCRTLLERKFFYLLTCEYCFSHYVSAFFVFIAGYKLLLNDWRGYLISWLAVVWIANQYISIFGRLRLDIKRERVEIEGVQEEVEAIKEEKRAA